MPTSESLQSGANWLAADEHFKCLNGNTLLSAANGKPTFALR
jgi:hypothetical protein